MDAPSAALTERRTAATPLKFSKILWATDFSSSSLASLPYLVAFPPVPGPGLPGTCARAPCVSLGLPRGGALSGQA